MLQASDAIRKSEFIFHVNPTKACHASTIEETRPGELVAAWFGGTAESNPDVGIWLSRWSDGDWSKPEEVVKPSGRDACYNPVLFQPRHGPLMLFYKVGTGPSTWHGELIRSQDGGRTWDKPTHLPKGIYGPIKNPPIELANNLILCPSSTEHDGWRVHFESTSDFGKTWKHTHPLNDPRKIGAIQPSILRMDGQALRAIGRTQQGRMFAIDSPDLGQTWGAMRLLDVPNPNSGTDAINLRDGRFLLVYNNTSTARSPLNVAISTDAEHWNPVVTLESQPGEFSYPTVIQTSDGLVHIVFTWNRVRIRHVVLDPTVLK